MLAGVEGPVGWHTFRRTVATLLVANGEDIKTVQESLRHANSKLTLDLYAQAITSTKRKAQSKIVQMLLPAQKPTAEMQESGEKTRLTNPNKPSPLDPRSRKLLKRWWPGTESNRRRQPFQGCALPAELPGHSRMARRHASLRVTRLLSEGPRRSAEKDALRAEPLDYSNRVRNAQTCHGGGRVWIRTRTTAAGIGNATSRRRVARKQQLTCAKLQLLHPRCG